MWGMAKYSSTITLSIKMVQVTLKTNNITRVNNTASILPKDSGNRVETTHPLDTMRWSFNHSMAKRWVTRAPIWSPVTMGSKSSRSDTTLAELIMQQQIPPPRHNTEWREDKLPWCKSQKTKHQVAFPKSLEKSSNIVNYVVTQELLKWFSSNRRFPRLTKEC